MAAYKTVHDSLVKAADGSEVLRFPCNQFGDHEPGTDADPLSAFLRAVAPGHQSYSPGGHRQWNLIRFLIDPDESSTEMDHLL